MKKWLGLILVAAFLFVSGVAISNFVGCMSDTKQNAEAVTYKCPMCGKTTTVNKGDLAPSCSSCGGTMKVATVAYKCAMCGKTATAGEGSPAPSC